MTPERRAEIEDHIATPWHFTECAMIRELLAEIDRLNDRRTIEHAIVEPYIAQFEQQLDARGLTEEQKEIARDQMYTGPYAPPRSTPTAPQPDEQEQP